MARLFVLAFDDAGQTPLIKRLRAAGHKIALSEPRYPAYYDLLKQQKPPPEAILADCSTRPSHTREACAFLSGTKAYQGVPILLYNIRPDDEALTRQKVPRAILQRNDKVEPALASVLTPRAPEPHGSRTPP